MPVQHLRLNKECLYRSSTELGDLLASIGFAAHVLQLQGGPIQGRFDFLSGEQASLLRLQCNSAISVSYQRNPAVIALSLDIQGRPGVGCVHGQPLGSHVIAGVGQHLSHSFFQLSSDADILIALLPKQSLFEQLNLLGGEQCVRWMQDHNQLLLDPAAHRALAHQWLQWFCDPHGIPVDPISSTIKWLNDDTVKGSVPFRRVTRYQLVCDLIHMGASGAAEGLSLDQLADQLSCSRRSLIQGCKELLGLGPKELLRVQRLEKVHQALLASDSKAPGSRHSVTEIADRHGFQSRGHFAAAYRRQFGQLPMATLKKRA
jgi:AraC family ethanolamine operon transcriptional activator